MMLTSIIYASFGSILVMSEPGGKQ